MIAFVCVSVPFRGFFFLIINAKDIIIDEEVSVPFRGFFFLIGYRVNT